MRKLNSPVKGLEWNQRPSARKSLLADSEPMFRQLFEHSADAMLLCDPLKEIIVDCNQAAVEMMRAKSKQELLMMNPADLSPPFQPDGRSSHERVHEDTAMALRQGSHRFEWRARRMDGTELPLEVLLTPIQNGEHPLMATVCRDVSARKAREAALLESEQKFRELFEGSSDAIQILDPQRRKIVDCNEATVRMAGGKDKDWFLRQPVGTFSPERQPDGRLSAEAGKAWAERAAREGPQRFEWLAKRADGEEFPVEVLLSPVQLSGHLMLVSVSREISERKKNERAMLELNQSLERRVAERTAALSESEARFSAAFQASPIFIGILRMNDGAYVLANDAFVHWLGLPREEVIGRSSADFGMWESTAERDAALGDMCNIGSIRQREVRWRNRSGQLSTILLSAETIKLNNVPHILSFAQDITQRKRVEDEVLKTLEREKELSQLKSNFVSMVSHEFRTPLGIIQSSAELLRAFFEKMEAGQREEQLESITRNTSRMAGMMEEVLVLSRLDVGGLDFQPAALDLNSFCGRIVDEVLSATNRRCRIELSFDAHRAKAHADERLLGHIFTNLLSNAVKYSEAGETVAFAVERDGHDAVCSVRDRGIGISDDDQKQLFKAFHRGRNVGTRPGTGLGLLLVKRCAELHGGKVHVKSKIGEGTTVTIRLPVFGRKHEKNTDH